MTSHEIAQKRDVTGNQKKTLITLAYKKRDEVKVCCLQFFLSSLQSHMGG